MDHSMEKNSLYLSPREYLVNEMPVRQCLDLPCGPVSGRIIGPEE